MGGFRLMTVNLLNGRADPGRFASVLDRTEPDLVVIQEMGPDIVDVVERRYRYHDLDPRLDHQGRGVASRFPAVFGSAPLPWRWVAWARAEIDSVPVVVASTHMRNAVAFPWWTSVRLRGEQLAALFEWADATVGDGPFILAGDMNASPAWPVYRRLAERWEDLVLSQARAAGTPPASTWAWRPGWPRMLRIDHVFGRGARAVAAHIEPVRGSDHAAVVVDLVLDPSTQPRSRSA
jgi:endonuclease/exonuclease/phosphatase family metal-dependent hydrolase